MRSHLPHVQLRIALSGSVVATLLLIPSCRKPSLDPVDALTIGVASGDSAAPTVKTVGISQNGEKVLARLVHHGSSWVTERGICYGTSATPLVGSDETIRWTGNDNGEIGEFEVSLDSSGVRLVGPGMYVRAYATNGYETGYGEAFQLGGIMVYTDSVQVHGQTSSRVYARVIGSGSGERGVCYSTDTLPTVSLGNHAYMGAGSGGFSVDFTSLDTGQTYHVRAFARNTQGAFVYGNDVRFRTRLCPLTQEDAAGNVYNVVEIGDRCWFKENLRTRKCVEQDYILVSDGSGGTILTLSPTQDIPFIKRTSNDNHPISRWITDTTVKLCNYDFDSIYIPQPPTHGHLYNWYAVNDARGLCPAGWEVPSFNDWEQLINSLGGPTTAGAALKATSWDGTNSSGFSALPVGVLDSPSGLFTPDLGSWWTSTSSTDSTARAFTVSYGSNGVTGSDRDKWNGRSVRCIKTP